MSLESHEIDPSEVALEVMRQQNNQRKALNWLLDQELSKANRLLVTRAQMGGTISYVGSVTLEWFAQRVRFASNLPLFQHKIDPKTKKIVIDHDTISEISQRNPDWSRQAPITQYLVTRPTHKFPPVLVVLSRPWVDDPEAPDWGPDGRAMRSTASFMALDSEERIGLLEIGDDAMVYALDGQHRLMAAKGLIDLMNTGTLIRRNKEYKEQGVIKIADLADQYPGVSAVSVQEVARERIGIEIIAAVNAGERRDAARQRVRGVFVHVNMMAAGLSKGEIALLNEDDGFAIIAKKAALEHELLRPKEGVAPRVEWERPTLVRTATAFTTLETLKECAHDYLHFVAPYSAWRPQEKGLVPIRPEEDQLEQGLDELSAFLSALAKAPSVQEMLAGASPRDLRPFLAEGGKSAGLYRPVTQRAVASAVGALVFMKKLSLESVMTRLYQLDAEGGFQIDAPSSPFYGILYDLAGRIREAGRDLASDVLRFMLGGGFTDESARDDLRKQLTTRRTDPVQAQVIGWDGEHLAPGAKLALPPVL